MNKKNLVIIYPDIKYVLPIVSGLVKLYDEKCDFSLFYDISYFEAYLETNPKIDIIIMDKALYYERYLKLNIKNVLLFTDDDKESSENTSKLNVQLVYKYYSVKEIVNEICSCSVLKGIDEAEGIVTATIVVYSPIGGAGTTAIALGLSEALTNKHHRVLYFNTGRLQNFAYKFRDKSPLDDSAVKRFRETDKDFYSSVKASIRTEGFDYIPPFPRCFLSLNLLDRNIVQAITKIKESGYYDYIVIDTASELNECNSELMAHSDNVLLVGRPDAESMYKFNLFLNAIDCSDKDKYRFVCNFAVNNMQSVDSPFVTEYVHYEMGIPFKSIEELGVIPDIERLGIWYL